MLSTSTLLKHYKRLDIQEVMVSHARDKEVGVRFHDVFGKRPDVLTYPRDILELARRGMTSLHASEERWSNPLSLHSTITKKELETMRTGWDLVLDIDCAIFEYSRICADLVIHFLRYCGVTSCSVKFSGNKGFHIGIPFEAFPTQVRDRETRLLFPEAARKIAAYVAENIKEELGKRLLEFVQGDIALLKETVGLPTEDLIYYKYDPLGNRKEYLRVDKFLEIDTVLISSRHLYRMPYSLHEKSGLVSLPLSGDTILQFEKQMAVPEAILTPMVPFLDRNVEPGNARNLLIQSLDFEVKQEREGERFSTAKNSAIYNEQKIESPIQEEFFPACMQKILRGMEDGKKRGLFCLMNFLGKIGWSKPEIETFLLQWNQKNPEPLRENYIRGQLASFVPGAKLPPNCDTDGYYRAMGVECGAAWCAKVKNPVNYTLGKWRRVQQDQEEQKKSGKKNSTE